MSTLRVNNMTNVGGDGPTYAKGMVIQTISVTNSTAVSTTSSAYSATVTASITPKSINSKILIIGSVPLYVYRAGNFAGAYVSIHRDSTNIYEILTSNYGAGTTIIEYRQSAPVIKIDTPATTSAITYSLRIASNSTSQVDANTAGNSQITLMEVAA